MEVPKIYPRSSEINFKAIRSFDWEGDVLTVTDGIVNAFRDATDLQIIGHYQVDCTELREFLEAKRAGKELRPVVTCGECEYWEDDWTPRRARDGCHYCPVLDQCKPADWFCAEGKKREVRT